MSASNRAQVINKLFKIAKKHYPQIPPPSSRGVLEHMLYACCLENSHNEAADEAFAKLEENYFDWNEVRVTTTNELCEHVKSLSDPNDAAINLKKTLHGVFETYYKFDIDFLKKENLRKTVQQLSKFRGVSPFIISYTAQVALGGHFIPLDEAMLNLMYVIGAVSEDEAKKAKVPGLERTIAKTKGVEFASVVHQLAAAFHKSPFGKEVRDIILSISADAKDRFPKRGGRKKKEEAEPQKPKAVAKTAKSGTAQEKKVAKKKTVKKKAPAKAAKKAPSKPVKKAAKTTKKKTVKKKTTKKTATKKATSSTKKKAPAKKKTTKKKSSSRSLSKKKPR